MKSWFISIELALIVMVMLRIFSGLIEISAAMLMLKLNSIEKAIGVNAALAIIGPTVFLTSILVGLVGMSDKLSLSKFLFIGAGVILIFIGIRK
ncbi:YqhV family protein [Alkalihalobacillus pseudalcaliphilus]|uniref:YqhV family protein n=1 Tax=Alkalihalobacillus pseudalcaliphilus TaxID=79884 RepID=UPI00064DEF1A|nr:YqhV family protein [Alkalihalobacillus pseudalcaliphilus]KMK76985.1 membrane protein [Alkalihalobacillus pseudalcaliphilus]